MKCPKCYGKIRMTKKPGGNVYRCCNCHRKYEVDKVKGGLKQVAV